ncbi:hypothetical protein DRN69_05230 [Candidatus Pacearchaeota archaeon]|nr:MAG: hypothetical protein DRN69_05230 [Candidatus Pacearchaeota archaeon]
MGSRTWYYYDCPKCRAKDGVEVYDAPSSLLHSEQCQYCDYKVDLDYYYISENEIALLSKKQAKEKGLLCKKCGQRLYPSELKEGICEACKIPRINSKRK